MHRCSNNPLYWYSTSTIVTTGKCHLVLKYYGYHTSFTTDLVVISHAGKGLLGFKLKNCVVCTVTALYYT